MSVNSIPGTVPPLPSLDSPGWNPQEVDEASRQARVKDFLATLDLVNAEVEDKVGRGEITWNEIEEFVASLDGRATQDR